MPLQPGWSFLMCCGVLTIWTGLRAINQNCAKQMWTYPSCSEHCTDPSFTTPLISAFCKPFILQGQLLAAYKSDPTWLPSALHCTLQQSLPQRITHKYSFWGSWQELQVRMANVLEPVAGKWVTSMPGKLSPDQPYCWHLLHLAAWVLCDTVKCWAY